MGVELLTSAMRAHRRLGAGAPAEDGEVTGLRSMDIKDDGPLSSDEQTDEGYRSGPGVPDELGTVDVEKASGVVELPLHIRWSGPSAPL